MSETAFGESVFWQDLRDDMRDPGFAAAYARASEELAGEQVITAVLEETRVGREITIFEVPEDDRPTEIGDFGAFAEELLRIYFPESEEAWVQTRARELANTVAGELAEEFGEEAVRWPGVVQRFGGGAKLLRIAAGEDEAGFDET